MKHKHSYLGRLAQDSLILSALNALQARLGRLLHRSSGRRRVRTASEGLFSALRRRAGRATDYLLTASEQFIEPRNYYERYQRMLREAGLPPHSFHALRHTFATRCIENGLDPKSVSELLGHANVRITLERYVHPSLEGKRKFLERFSPANRGQNGGRSPENS